MSAATATQGPPEAGWAPGTEGEAVLALRGRWTVEDAAELEELLDALARPAGRSVTLDLSAVTALDTVGALLLHHTLERLRHGGAEVDLSRLDPRHRTLLATAAEHGAPAPAPPPEPAALPAMVERVGAATVQAGRDLTYLVAFLGAVTAAFGRTLRRPSRLRRTSLVFHMEAVGLDALPIVGLMSFLIGVVLAYQGAVQLRQFGAEVFVVDLIGIAVLREFGILLTAIMVAGRSGSAFTAQLGAMKLDEETAALRTLGLDPMEVLVLPRVLALVVTLPLLTFFADLMGLFGGGLMSWSALGVTPQVFFERLRVAVDLQTFAVGLVKAPVFAAVIGLVGCAQGLAVAGSSESLGRHTTRAVVESIFLVIVLDAFFSIFFNLLGV